MPFIGEITMFAGTRPLEGWVRCDGRWLEKQTHQALYSVIGDAYGSDVSRFRVPDLGGRVPMHPGSSGPGAATHALATSGGSTTATLTIEQIPVHEHKPRGTTTTASSPSPKNNVWAKAPSGAGHALYGTGVVTAVMNLAALAPTGGGLPHNNLQPYLALAFMICVDGDYPVRSD